MVSERYRSYAAAVTAETETGDENGGEQATSSDRIPMNSSPVQLVDELHDPMYLHVTENPNLVLVSPPLSEVNYATWSRSMRIALEVKNKFGFVDGSIASPAESDPRFPIWRRCNNIVCSWIFKALSPMIAEGVLYFEVAAEIWSVLKKRYSQVDAHRIAELQNEIYRSTQGNLSINEYFTKSNALWVQMNAMRPIPKCECVPRCSCALISKIQKEKQEDQIIRFLEGLNEEYENIKSGILVMDPIPAMENVLNMALKMERKLRNSGIMKNPDLIQSNSVQNITIQNSDDQSTVAVATSFNKKKFSNNSGKNVPKCVFCGKLGHTIEKCYKKHGFPPGWIPGYKSKDKQAQETQPASSQSQGSHSSNNTVTLSNTGINSDSRKVAEKHNEDSGATDHITSSLDYFESHYAVHGVSVRLPNGETVDVTHIGNIKLHMDMMLKNVLFIPSFSFNIVSASKLVRESGCEIIIGADCCDVQGHLGRVDGFAKEKGGLSALQPSYQEEGPFCSVC
ncbi:PREDICTED: uncharacterized protein LOC109174448 [Ipomoea nil]|uniref:uncharacterized protein LOC109174448 n=1 Tax=Ipomoea nil TaxID=35883 RepID=UPI000901CD8E|nr:PREDICTED: uncharacterized protein LOC109174448 [Ipomoea nil]